MTSTGPASGDGGGSAPGTPAGDPRGAAGARPRPRWPGWLLAALVPLAGWAAYANSFGGVFVHPDEFESIAENKHIRRLWPPSEPLSAALWGTGATFDRRPVASLSFALSYHFFGPGLWGHHAGNLIVHLLAAVVLFDLVRRSLPPGAPPGARGGSRGARGFALAVALLWVVHPLNTEAVTYMVQRAESLVSLFLLLTVYCAARGFGAGAPAGGGSPGGRSAAWLAASVAACALGMGSKELMVVAPLLVLAYEHCFGLGAWGGLRRRPVYYAALAATWMVLGALLLITAKDVKTDFVDRSPLAYFLTQPGVIFHYLQLALWPHPLTTDYYWPLARRAAEIVPYALPLCLGFAAALWGLYRRRWYGFVGAWFFLVLAPTSSFVATMDLVQEHRMYAPLAAVLILVVAAGDSALRLTCGGRPGLGPAVLAARWAAVALGVLWLGALTHLRNRDYHDLVGFWQHNLTHRPDSATGHVGMADAWMVRRRFDLAEREFHRAAAVPPRGRGFPPSFPAVFRRLGRLQGDRGDLAGAVESYRAALRLNPRFALAHAEFALLLERAGQTDAAEHHYREAVRYQPALALPYFRLGHLAELRGEFGAAREHYLKAAARFTPRSLAKRRAAVQMGLGRVALRADDPRAAGSHFRRALAIDPASPGAHFWLGKIYSRAGDADRGIAHFRRAAQLAPGEAEVAEALAEAIEQAGRGGTARTKPGPGEPGGSP